VNSFEAESRRLARFSRLGHTPGSMVNSPAARGAEGSAAPGLSAAIDAEFPFTLDLRKVSDGRSTA
jgi:uncharacterized protein (DUF2126 family)